jgi:hypothetical protein
MITSIVYEIYFNILVHIFVYENILIKHKPCTGSGAHPASYPIGTRGSFLGVKAAGA